MLGTRVRKVVIAEDRKQEAFKLRQIVESGGYRTVQIFENGRDFLKWLEAHPDEADLVLLDIIMPTLDGYAAFAEMKQRWPDSPIRTIFVTIENSKPVAEALLKMGAAGIVNKPLDRDAVLTAIKQALT
ncbi:MAG: response regulator [Leptospirales bacterium]|nr:response regulator [Leptospirales bacterium]